MLSGEDLDFQAAIAGQYSIDRELGRGGMGVVYLAREALLDRPVALKRLPLDMAGKPDARERFLREARTAAQLFHPNIVPIHRVAEVGDFVFFAMGYVEGETLGQLVRRRGPLPAHQVARILREVAYALGYGHSRGVVHRDIKPDNLLHETATGRTLVTDFGIAQREGTTGLTQDGQMLGSVHYMSPEQISGAEVDGRADLYALGALSHFLLTGRPPFDHATPTAILGMHLQKAPPAISSVAEAVPRQMADAIDRCLAKDPSLRFNSADQFAESLAQTDQRREMPPELRAWVKGAGMFDGGLVFIAAIAIGLITATSDFRFLAIPLLYALTQRVRATGQLLRQGYDANDLATAISEEMDRVTEESQAQVSKRSVKLARPFRWLSFGGFAVFGAGWVASAFLLAKPAEMTPEQGELFVRVVGPSIMIGLGVGIASGLLAYLISPSQSAGSVATADYKWRIRFWRSKAGSLLARLLRGKGKVRTSADRDRPTEILVGAAAVSLYEALPRDVRKQLPQVRETVEKLEQRARELRARRDELDGLARSARPLRSAEATVIHRETAGDLAIASEKVGNQLALTIAALETIRLDLLRLHAGRGSTDDLSAAVAAARAIGDDVETALAGKDTVERLLKQH